MTDINENPSNSAPTVNQKQFEYWNGEVGKKWQTHHLEIEEMLRNFTNALIDEIGNVEGKHILDIGCGAGETSYILASKGANILGADISKPLLKDAIERDDFGNKDKIEFSECDVSTYEFVAEAFDMAISRFGIMFFDDNINSFKNIRKSIKKGGRIVFIAWQSPQENEWIRVPMASLKGIAEAVSANNPDAPGPFAFHNPERVKGILEQSGFNNIKIQDIEAKLYYNKGRGLEKGVGLLSKIGPASRSLANLPVELQKIGMEKLTATCKEYMDGDTLTFNGKIWLVSANA